MYEQMDKSLYGFSLFKITLANLDPRAFYINNMM